MADNVIANTSDGLGATFATDEVGGAHYPYTKVVFGADNTATLVTSSTGLPVGDAGGTLTVDAPVGTPVFVRLSDGSAAITTLAVSLASVPSHAVTNAGTFAVQVDGSALTSLQLIDDPVIADDAAFTPATSKVMMAGFQFDDNTPDSVDEGDAGAARMSANRSVYTQIRDAAGNERGVNVDASNRLNVAVGNTVTVGSHDVTNAGTFLVQATLAAGTATIAKAEDAGHSSGDTGAFVLAVRSDTAASTGQTDGDYSALITDSSGRLHVNVGNSLTVGSHDVTNAGTFAVQVDGAALTALQLIDNPVLVDDAAFTPASSSVMMAGFQFDDAAPDSVNEGDAGAARMSANRNVYTTIRDAAGNERGVNVDSSNRLSVSVDNTVTVASHAVTNAGTFAVQVDGSALTALQLIDDPVFTDDAAFTPGTSKVMMFGAQCDASGPDSVDEGDAGALRMTADRALHSSLRDSAGNNRGANVNASNELLVTATQSGTWNVGTVTTVTTCSTVTALTGSGVAHDAADSGNPHKIGAKAETALSGITLVSDGDRTDLHAGVDGVLIVRPHTNLEDIVAGNASNTDGSSTEVIAAGGANVKQYLTSCSLTNTSATDTYCELKSGTTVRWRFVVPAGGGVTHSWPVPLPPNAANEAWNFDMAAAVTTAYCSLNGFKSKV